MVSEAWELGTNGYFRGLHRHRAHGVHTCRASTSMGCRSDRAGRRLPCERGSREGASRYAHFGVNDPCEDLCSREGGSSDFQTVVVAVAV